MKPSAGAMRAARTLALGRESEEHIATLIDRESGLVEAQDALTEVLLVFGGQSRHKKYRCLEKAREALTKIGGLK